MLFTTDIIISAPSRLLHSKLSHYSYKTCCEELITVISGNEETKHRPVQNKTNYLLLLHTKNVQQKHYKNPKSSQRMLITFQNPYNDSIKLYNKKEATLDK